MLVLGSSKCNNMCSFHCDLVHKTLNTKIIYVFKQI